MKDDRIRIDLCRLAVERCRDAFMSVGQLVENDAERSSLAVTVAADLIIGAVMMLKTDRRFRKKGDGDLVDYVLTRLGEALHGKYQANDPRSVRGDR